MNAIVAGPRRLCNRSLSRFLRHAIGPTAEPEVAAAGHGRTIININIKPEHVDAWLNPDPTTSLRCTRPSTISNARSANTGWRHEH